MPQDTDSRHDLTILGQTRTSYPATPGEATLETFANRHPGRDYWVTFECPEFTSRCPVTNQPDFGHITIRYIPDHWCIESKSLKLYLFAFRETQTFHEEVVNRILDDVKAACQPREIMVEGRFNPRGGISICVTCRDRQDESGTTSTAGRVRDPS